MEDTPEQIAAKFDSLIKRLENEPRTEKESQDLRKAIQTSWKPRLAHHLLKIKNAKTDEEWTTSMTWILNYFEEQNADNARLRKYQHNARKSMKSLQRAYENKSRLYEQATSRATSSEDLAMEILPEANVVSVSVGRYS